jgi:periplasmic divalent cation tolerance protein
VSYTEDKGKGAKRNQSLPRRLHDFIQVLTTTQKQADAEKIAAALIERRLAGCVQIIGPITSTYRWKGRVEITKEWLCVIKSAKNLYRDLEQTIHEIHPYEIPEIVAMPILAGSKDYLKWLGRELKKE